MSTQRLLFGRDRSPDEVLVERTKMGTAKSNPCIPAFGSGPEGRICRDCDHLVRVHLAKDYYKCDLRAITASATSDHRVRWPACARFVERSE